MVGTGFLTAAYAVAAVLTGSLSALAWRNRETRAARPLAGVLAAIAIWSGAALVAAATESLRLSVVWASVQLIALAATISLLFWFAVSFADQSSLRSRPVAAVLPVYPVFVLVATLTNAPILPGGHTLFYESVSAAASVQGVVAVWGPLYWVHFVVAYLLVFGSTVVIVATVWRSGEIYREQSLLVVLAILVPWIENAVGTFTALEGGNYLAIAFAITGTLLFVAMRRYGLTDIAPVARSVVVDTIDDGVIVVDDRGRVVDLNGAARALLGATTGEVTGEPVEDAFPALPAPSLLGSGAAERHDVTVRVEGETRHLEVQPSPLERDDGDRIGTVLLVHDVTERRERQEALEQKQAQLDRFASVVSHDLRNPLGVSQGYVDLLEDTGDLSYVEEIRRGHDRMESLIDDLLTLARDGSAAKTTAVALGSVVEDAWSAVETADATLDVRDPDVTIEAAPTRLRQLFENAVRNAVEHAGADVTVTVAALRDDDGEVRGFVVEDDGPGIPPADREAVLQPGVSRAEGGTGLGLSIVANVAATHGWAVSIGESGAGGARFEFDERGEPREPVAGVGSD